MKKQQSRKWIVLAAFAIVLAVTAVVDAGPARAVVGNIRTFALSLLTVLPPAFVLIGLFEVWVPRALVERHLGADSGARGYLWALLLAGTTVGGLYVAFPVAWTLQRKGAHMGVILAYVGFSGITRIPMTLFEISFLGAEFTLVRYLTAVPLVVVSSWLLGRLLTARSFELRNPEAS